MPPRPTLRDLIRGHRDVLGVIAVGGALGTLARWGLAEAIPHRGRSFPLATFLTNVSGALLMGLLMAFVLVRWSRSRYVRPFLGVGVIGGYTTFSTYELDAHGLLQIGATDLAFAYLLTSLVVGFAALIAGLVAGRALLAAGRSRHARERSHDASHDPSHERGIATDAAPQED